MGLKRKMLKRSWILFHKMQTLTSLRCRSLCIFFLRVYSTLRTTQNPQFSMTFIIIQHDNKTLK